MKTKGKLVGFGLIELPEAKIRLYDCNKLLKKKKKKEKKAVLVIILEAQMPFLNRKMVLNCR